MTAIAADRIETGYRDLLELAELVGYPLEPFQRRIARAALGGQREVLISIGRGNAKTSLASLLALHELVSNKSARIYFVAASVPQARIAFESAAEFARRLDDPHIVFRHLELRWCEDPDEPTRFSRHLRVLGAEGPRLHGLTPTLMLLDELQAITRQDVYPALASALHKSPTSRLLVISTAGSGPETSLGQLRARALGLRSVRRRGALVDCEGPDLRALLWEVPPEVPLTVREIRKANPASWLIDAGLKEQQRRLAERDFRRFICNQWISDVSCWLPAGAWQSCAGETRFEDGEKVWAALDVGGTEANIALVWCNSALHVGVKVWAGDEGVLYAKEAVGALAGRYSLQELAYDPWRARQLALELEQRRIRTIQFPQSPSRMCAASAGLYRAVVEGRLTHPDDRILNAHVAHAVAKDSPRGWQVAKAPGGGNVDAAIALAMCVERASEPAKPEPRLVGWL